MPPHSGVLVLNADASVQHVDAEAPGLLQTDRASLLGGTAEVLHNPVTTADGTTYGSLKTALDDLLVGTGSNETIWLSDVCRAELRVSYGPDGPTGAILLLSEEETSPHLSDRRDSSGPQDEPTSADAKRLRDEQNRLLEKIASGSPLSEVLTDLITFIEGQGHGLIGSVLLLDPESETLHHGAAPHLPDAYIDAIDGLQIGPSACAPGAAAYGNELIVTENVDTDERWSEHRDLALAHDLNACWSMPITGEDDEILGTFALYYDEPHAPSETEQSLVTEASYVASVAIEHDRQKRARQLQEEQFQRLVENAQPIVFLLDEDGTILISEGEDLSRLGLEPGEVVGKSIYELYSDSTTLLQYIDRALDGEAIDNILELGDVVLDIWYSPYYDSDGEVAGCIGMAVDITERQEAEQALRSSRDLLRRTQELAGVGGWEYDPQTDVMVGTEETYRIYEIPEDAEFTLEQSLTFYPNDVEMTLREAATRCLRDGEPFDLEGPMTANQGTERWVRIRGEPRQNDDGTTTKLVGTVQDLTERHEIEAELRKQKRWLQSINENIAGGIYRSTENGLVYANQAFLQLFGYDDLEEMASVDPRSFYDDPDVRADLIRRENDRGGLDGVEVEFRRKDGSTFTGLLRSRKVVPEGEQHTYYDGVVTDITVQKTRERKYRNQRQKIEAFYESSGRLLEATSHEEVASILTSVLTETFGYPGVVVRCLHENRLVPISAEPRSPNLPAYEVSGESLAAKIYRSGNTQVIDDLRKIGDRVDTEQAQSGAGLPLGDYGLLTLASVEGREIEGFDLRLIDILAQKATAVLGRIEHEKHLRESEKRFRGLFEEAALGIAMVDPEGIIVEANPELTAMFGYGEKDLEGRPFPTLAHPDQRDPLVSSINELVERERERYEIEQQYVRRDDTIFWGRLTVSPHTGPGEADVICMIEDVSSRKRYEHRLKEAKKEAEEASRLKSALLANMSHEIRTPLTSIIGFAAVLEDNLSGPNAEYARLAHEGGKRLMDTLDSVLQLSKLEAGVLEPSAEQTDLVEVVRRTVNLSRPEADSADLSLRFDPAVDALRGRWAPTAVQRVLSNLIRNAIKFTSSGGSVIVRVRSTDSTAVLEVEDTGVGISDEFRPRLFDAFTQESEGLKREHEGSGLGLAIVKRLVDLLEGHIELESTKGEGTCFTIRLPRNT